MLISLAMVAVPALGMGICFPMGLRLMDSLRAQELGPWLWGINGAFGVCASGIALGVSMIWGISTTLALGALCYLLLLLCTRRLMKC